jgi:hypothetical protein
MQTKATIEPARSPVPGVIPEPVRVHHDGAAPDPAHTARRTARRGPASRMLGKLLGALHGDKYMIPTDPPTWPPASATVADLPGAPRTGETS